MLLLIISDIDSGFLLLYKYKEYIKLNTFIKNVYKVYLKVKTKFRLIRLNFIVRYFIKIFPAANMSCPVLIKVVFYTDIFFIYNYSNKHVVFIAAVVYKKRCFCICSSHCRMLGRHAFSLLYFFFITLRHLKEKIPEKIMTQIFFSIMLHKFKFNYSD